MSEMQTRQASRLIVFSVFAVAHVRARYIAPCGTDHSPSVLPVRMTKVTRREIVSTAIGDAGRALPKTQDSSTKVLNFKISS